jgi:enoyl-CoA hydratase
VNDGLSTTLADNVVMARIERPETRNALDTGLMGHLADLLEHVDADPDARCIVLTGTDEFFATGADIRLLAEPGANQALRHETAIFWDRFAAIKTPIVAAVTGWALGPGCELALASDMVVASDKAQFGLPEITLGVIPGGGATQRLARVAGKQRAMELILTGRRFSTDQAYEWGLVNARTKVRDCVQQAHDLAAHVARSSPIAVQLAKRAILAAEQQPLDHALETEKRLLAEAMATEDRIEAVNAVMQNRKPDFEGR